MTPIELYQPDGSRLSTMIIGQPGSGKSYFVHKTISNFMMNNDDENQHCFYICPKHEMEFGENSVTTLEALHKHMRKHRIHVFYPDIDYLDVHVDAIIDRVFDIQAVNPDLKSTLILDDSQIFLDSRKSPSDALKRITLVGRSKNIRFVSISHSFVFSKVLEGSTSYIVHFRSLTSPIHLKDANNRYGYDPTNYIESLQNVDYSHVIFDVSKGRSLIMQPV